MESTLGVGESTENQFFRMAQSELSNGTAQHDGYFLEEFKFPGTFADFISSGPVLQGKLDCHIRFGTF